CVEQLHRRPARTGDALLRHTPHTGDVSTGPGVADRAGTGQLVGLLPVLTPALTVALPGDRAVARSTPAGQTEDQGEVDRGSDSGGALGGLLHTAPGEQVGAGAAVAGCGSREPVGHPAQHPCRYSADRLRTLRPPAGGEPAYRLQPGAPL